MAFYHLCPVQQAANIDASQIREWSSKNHVLVNC